MIITRRSRPIYAGVVEKLRQALRTDNDPVIMQGEAILGIEAAAAALIARDDVVLNLVSGVYGKGFADLGGTIWQGSR